MVLLFKIKAKDMEHLKQIKSVNFEEENVTIDVKASTKRLKVCQYCAILTVCLALLLSQVIQCFHRYLGGATGTADKYVHISQTGFPDISTCPENPYNETVLQVQ